MGERVLLVEDRPNLRAVIAGALGRSFDVEEAGDLAEARARLAQAPCAFAAVVTDVRLPDGVGTALLADVRAHDPPPAVVLMTAYAAVPDAVAALRDGAFDYLAKPFEPDELVRVVGRAAERTALLRRTRALEDALDAREGALLGASPALQSVRRMVERVATRPVPVLLVGESGTGKEVVAREIHRIAASDAAAVPRIGRFVAVNCGAIPEQLLESELFGAARGAYSGATADRKGLVEEADGGTLFLDEIGDLPLPMQVKLNRALEEGEVRRVGETRARVVDLRVIAATHRDLDAMVAEGTFRADLYYRLKGVQIRLPPLRERVEDVPMLAGRFLRFAAARFGAPARRLSPDALAALERAPWPGNVRELRHAVEHAVALADGAEVQVADLPDELRAHAPDARPGTWRGALEAAQARAARDYLAQLMRSAHGNVSRAAEVAEVERETLHRLLRRHGVEPGRFRDG